MLYLYKTTEMQIATRGGGTLILSHIPRLGHFLGVQNLNFNIIWSFQKNDFFFGGGGGMKILWIYFLGHHKIGLYLGVISIAFQGLFVRSRYRISSNFWTT